MKEADQGEGMSKETILSVALVRDILKRHLKATADIVQKDYICACCKKPILKGEEALLVLNFPRIFKIVLCDRDCVHANEHKEMKIFGCEKLEQLPFMQQSTNLHRVELLKGYYARICKMQQDVVDRVVSPLGSYQMASD